MHRLKYHPGQYAVAQNIRRILEGSWDIVDDLQVSSQLTNENEEFLHEETETSSSRMSAPIEDAYSLRYDSPLFFINFFVFLLYLY